MVQNDAFIEANVFRLWLVVIIGVVVMNILGIILGTIGHSIFYAIRTQEEPEDQEFMEDERDKLIDLKGTRMAYIVASLGMLAAMLTFVLDQPPLVMFTVLVGTGLVAQIAGDIFRLTRYQRGF
jgi:hypothetical protein